MIANSKYNKRIGTLLTIIIATLMLVSLTGCTKTTIAPPNDTAGSNDPTYSNSTKQEEAAKASIEDQKASISKEQKDYYCKWSISKVLEYGTAGTYSKEDAEKLVGKNLSFSADEAQIFTDQPSDTATIIKKPSYEEVTISRSDFMTNFGMSFDKLGIGTDSVTELIISGSDASAILLIKDSTSMILVAGGTYFELVPLRG
jgi:bla regulator protein blaR1